MFFLCYYYNAQKGYAKRPLRISISGAAYPPRCISGRRLHGAAEDKTGKEKTMESKKDPEKGKKKKEKSKNKNWTYRTPKRRSP